MPRALIYTTLKSGLIVNIKADRIVESGDYIKIFYESELVAMFDIGIVKCAYLTFQKISSESESFIKGTEGDTE